MYALGRSLAKQGARRWSPTGVMMAARSSEAAGQQAMPLASAVTAAALLVAVTATPISTSACEDIGGISMEKLTAEW